MVRMPWCRAGAEPITGGEMPIGTPVASVRPGRGVAHSRVRRPCTGDTTGEQCDEAGRRGTSGPWSPRCSTRRGAEDVCTLWRHADERAPARSRVEAGQAARALGAVGTAGETSRAATRRDRTRGPSAAGTWFAASTPSTMSATTSANGRPRSRTETTAPRRVAPDGAGGARHPGRRPERGHVQPGLVGGGAEAARGVGEAEGGQLDDGLGDGPVVHDHQPRRGV